MQPLGGAFNKMGTRALANSPRSAGGQRWIPAAGHGNCGTPLNLPLRTNVELLLAGERHRAVGNWPPGTAARTIAGQRRTATARVSVWSPDMLKLSRGTGKGGTRATIARGAGTKSGRAAPIRRGAPACAVPAVLDVAIAPWFVQGDPTGPVAAQVVQTSWTNAVKVLPPPAGHGGPVRLKRRRVRSRRHRGPGHRSGRPAGTPFERFWRSEQRPLPPGSG